MLGPHPGVYAQFGDGWYPAQVFLDFFVFLFCESMLQSIVQCDLFLGV